MSELSAAAHKATDYCAYCPKMCRFSCPVAEAEARETVTPWGLMSLLRAVRREEVELTAEVGEVFYHCTGCARCQVYCLHDNDVAGAMLEGRQLMVSAGVPIPGPLQGLDLLQIQHGTIYGAPSLQDVEAAFDPESKVGFKPECKALSEDPGRVARVGRTLEQLLGKKVALVSAEGEGSGAQNHCCGEVLREAGYGALADQVGESTWASSAAYDEVITDCTGMMRAWSRRNAGAERGRPLHLVEVFARELSAIIEGSTPPQSLASKRVFYCDDPVLGRQFGLYDQPRAVLGAALGQAPHDLWLSREKSLELGRGGHYEAVDPEGSAQAAKLLGSQAKAEGVEVLVTVKRAARDHLRTHTSLEAYDLFEVVADALGIE